MHIWRSEQSTPQNQNRRLHIVKSKPHWGIDCKVLSLQVWSQQNEVCFNIKPTKTIHLWSKQISNPIENVPVKLQSKKSQPKIWPTQKRNSLQIMFQLYSTKQGRKRLVCPICLSNVWTTFQLQFRELYVSKKLKIPLALAGQKHIFGTNSTTNEQVNWWTPVKTFKTQPVPKNGVKRQKIVNVWKIGNWTNWFPQAFNEIFHHHFPKKEMQQWNK